MFRHDITAIGVRFDTPAATGGPGTARCLILVTPDGQRTMDTYLGACVELGPDDIDPDLIAAAQVTYLEGYLFDPPLAQEAFRKAAAIAHAAGRQVALSLSDPFCVGRHRAAFRELVDGRCRHPVRQRGRDLLALRDGRFRRGRGRGARPCRDRRPDPQRSGQRRSWPAAPSIRVAAAPVARVVDTTGAGDLYASGFLYGLTRGLPLPICGEIGSLCAAEIISHVGARPEVALSQASPRPTAASRAEQHQPCPRSSGRG